MLIVIGVVVVAVAIYAIAALTGNLQTTEDESNSNLSTGISSHGNVNNDSQNATDDTSKSETSEIQSENVNFGWDSLNSSTKENTSARVDEILSKAGDDAKNTSEDIIEPLWTESLDYLVEHSEDFYENNEVMEKSMYYGQFISRYIEENATANDISELPDSTRAAYDAGYNTVKAIKYVYRGEEKIEDESTQNALAEAQTALKSFK